MQLNPVEDRLLQRCASWRTDWHHSETEASPEHHSLDCAPGVKAFPCLVVVAPAAMAASSAADHVQADSSDVQSSEHVHSKLLA